MDLRQLRHFIAVAELGNFSRAAERVYLTQPALTRSIKTLEDEIDARLFDRRSSGAEMTAAGIALLEHARVMVNEQERAQQRILLAKRGQGEELVVAVCPLQSPSDIRAISAQFAREHPDVSLRIIEGHVDETVPALIDRKVDLIFTTVPATTMEQKLVYERIGSMSCSVFAGPSHPLARRREITAAELSRWAWAMLDQKHAMAALRNYFAVCNCGLPAGGVKTNSIPFITSMILNEGMIAILPDGVMKGTGAVALDVVHRPSTLRSGLLFRDDPAMKRSAGLFADKLRAQARRPDAEEAKAIRPVPHGPVGPGALHTN